LILTNSLSFYSFPESCSIFLGLFPWSPPESYFNSGDNGAWVTHHEKLKKYFSQFPYEKVPQEEQLWKDGEDSIIFIFLPGRLTNVGQNFTPFLPKLKVSRYHLCRHEAGTLKATHHGFHVLNSKEIAHWTLFQEIFLNFLKSVKPLLFYVEEVLLRVCWEKWFQMRLQVPWNYGIFGTIWTIVVHNPSFTNWHFNPGDFGLAALLYFGEFTREEIQLGPFFCKTIPL
jgi:hypothetical protein